MSQYPPQQPANYDYYRAAGASGDPRGAAKRASTLMFVMGGLMILLGGCFASLGAMLPGLQLPPESQQAMRDLEAQVPGVSISMLMMVAGAGMVFVALLYLLLGFFVRGGGRGAVVTAMVLTGLTVGYLAINALAAVLGTVPNGAASACFSVVPMALFVLLMIWLYQAFRAGPGAAAAMQQYQAQFWYYQQQQQAYQQAILGGVPLPPSGQALPPQHSTAPYGQMMPPAVGYGYGYGAPQPLPQQQPPVAPTLATPTPLPPPPPSEERDSNGTSSPG